MSHNKKYNKEVEELLLEILRVIYRINTKTNCDALFYYSSKINGITVDTDAEIKFNEVLNDYPIEKLKKLLNDLKHYFSILK